MAEKRIGFRTIFRCDTEGYENWKREWESVTKLICLNAAKRRMDLSKIKIVREDVV